MIVRHQELGTGHNVGAQTLGVRRWRYFNNVDAWALGIECWHYINNIDAQALGVRCQVLGIGHQTLGLY